METSTKKPRRKAVWRLRTKEELLQKGWTWDEGLEAWYYPEYGFSSQSRMESHAKYYRFTERPIEEMSQFGQLILVSAEKFKWCM